MPFIAVKGTHDLYGAEADGYAYIENVFRAVSELYGYRPIETPILEYTEGLENFKITVNDKFSLKPFTIVKNKIDESNEIYLGDLEEISQ